MRILMLGWEFPPFIAGGLGVACYGLTKALDRLGHEVVFILPKPVGTNMPSHVRMLSPRTVAAGLGGKGGAEGTLRDPSGKPLAGFHHAEFRAVASAFSSPYPAFETPNPGQLTALSDLPSADGSRAVRPGAAASGLVSASMLATVESPAEAPALGGSAEPAPIAAGGPGVGYGRDLLGDAGRYAKLVLSLAKRESFDVIHAHDWLTFPAGIAASKATGKPLVIHVHSTEFDRSGSNVNQRVFEIERAGMQAAGRVLAVSQFTKNICMRRYGIAGSKIDIVYNGIEQEDAQPSPGVRIESKDKIVLFVGRITMQKGPEYFIAAAKRVLEKVEDVKFVLAGAGDMAVRMIELAAGMGIGHKVLFTGFLRGKDVSRVYQMADCYVMPSVSEPFGLAALEAIQHDVPVILSKTSGASEVLTHVLKVDFWDIDEMANKILAVLRHPPLSATLREHGAFDLHRLTWEGAAERCVAAYGRA